MNSDLESKSSDPNLKLARSLVFILLGFSALLLMWSMRRPVKLIDYREEGRVQVTLTGKPAYTRLEYTALRIGIGFGRHSRRFQLAGTDTVLVLCNATVAFGVLSTSDYSAGPQQPIELLETLPLHEIAAFWTPGFHFMHLRDVAPVILHPDLRAPANDYRLMAASSKPFLLTTSDIPFRKVNFSAFVVDGHYWRGRSPVVLSILKPRRSPAVYAEQDEGHKLFLTLTALRPEGTECAPNRSLTLVMPIDAFSDLQYEAALGDRFGFGDFSIPVEEGGTRTSPHSVGAYNVLRSELVSRGIAEIRVGSSSMPVSPDLHIGIGLKEGRVGYSPEHGLSVSGRSNNATIAGDQVISRNWRSIPVELLVLVIGGIGTATFFFVRSLAKL